MAARKEELVDQVRPAPRPATAPAWVSLLSASQATSILVPDP